MLSLTIPITADATLTTTTQIADALTAHTIQTADALTAHTIQTADATPVTAAISFAPLHRALLPPFSV